MEGPRLMLSELCQKVQDTMPSSLVLGNRAIRRCYAQKSFEAKLAWYLT